MTLENKKKKKRKHKYHHYYLRITNDPNVPTRNHRMTGGSILFWEIIVIVLLFALVGFISFENYNSSVALSKEAALKSKITELQEENDVLAKENDALNEKINILSETVNQKIEVEQEIEEKSVPNGFPLSGAADYEEKDEKLRLDGENILRPMLEFECSDGAFAVASGNGVVSLVAEEMTYGYEVQIDHGNGYVSSYRADAEPMVKQGDEVSRGTPLFTISSDDDEPAKVAYQVLLDGEYINPSEVLEING